MCFFNLEGEDSLMKTHSQMKERLKWYVGRYIDWDKVFQAQCMDLTVDYMYWATDGKYRMLGNAIDAINTRANNYGNYATIHKNTKNFLPQVGDIAVWTQAPAHPTYGHIGIVYGNINLNTCTMLDQNWDGDPSKPAKLRTDNYRGVTHFIRINFKDESTPTKPSASTSTSGTHTVKKGETLFSISRKYNMAVDELMKINGLKNHVIHPGDKLNTKKNTASTTPKKPATSKPKAFNKYENRNRREDEAWFKGTVKLAEVRKRSGSQKTGFNWNKKAGYDIPTGEEVFIFEVHNGWGRIYRGELTGKGSNDWIHLDRLNVTKVFHK